MLQVIILSFVFLMLVMAAMAVGVILSNKPIKGSCGGIQALGLKEGCDICGGDADLCEKENRQQQFAEPAEPAKHAQDALFYNAGKK